MPENWRLFVMVSLCGGYTTFSAFSLQTLDLMRGGPLDRAGINVVASVVLCVAAVAIGHAAGAWINTGATRVAQTALEEDVLRHPFRDRTRMLGASQPLNPIGRRSGDRDARVSIFASATA